MSESAVSPRDPKPDLVDVVIALLVCSAMTIFVFWLATQFMRQESFQQIPDFIKSSFSGIFSVLVGASGIGVAVLRDLRRKPETRPDYLKLFGTCFVAIFSVILLIIAI